MEKIILQRVFIHTENKEEIRLPDPGEHFSPEEVSSFYSNTFPILTTSKISGPVFNNDEMQYRFESVMGTKG